MINPEVAGQVMKMSMPTQSRYSWQACLVLFIVLVSLTLGGCQPVPVQAATTQTDPITAPEPAPTVLEGKLVPEQFVTLSSSSGRRVAEVYAQEGQQVSAGDVLLRLDGYEQGVAEQAASQVEVVLARQALKTLFDNSALDLAEVELSIAETQKEQALARDHYRSISKHGSQTQIDQAYANLILAEKQINKARNDLEKAQKRFDNKKSLIWRFINKRQFKLRLTLLEQRVAVYERRYQDAQEKYEDLLDPPDEIDVALAQARLEDINANLKRLEQQRDDLRGGPDPDDVQAAQARINAAEARLASAELSLKDVQVTAPIDGRLVELNAKPGEWIASAAPFAVIADLNEWKVEIPEVAESLVPQLQADQPVKLQFDALPDLSLDGRIDSIDLLYTEDDGDVFYHTDIRAEQNDPRLRWGMTVRVELLQPDPNEQF
jgi:HlyD family secretion protein